LKNIPDITITLSTEMLSNARLQQIQDKTDGKEQPYDSNRSAAQQKERSDDHLQDTA
jgi:hypothetical protein